MKINWNIKYTTICVYTFILLSSLGILYLSISHLGELINKVDDIVKILQPFIIGFAIAYLLNFILKFYENKVLKKVKIKSKRGIAILLTYITLFFILSLFIKFVLPQLIDSVVGLINDIPIYINNTSIYGYNLLQNLNIDEEYLNIIMKNFNGFVDFIIKFTTNLIPVLGRLLATIASSIWNVILGLIISIYLLIDKDKLCALNKKMTYAILPEVAANKVIEITHMSNVTFGKFLSGKILDSFIIGVLTFLVLTIFKMPYILLISVIIGITNIIPFFGPFIGAVPAFIIILFISPTQALWFLLIILVIQQIDGNIIGPKILGNSIGISAFWILFSILIAGKVLGVLGMIIGVPLFAIVYSIIKDVIEVSLKKKGLKSETKDYM
ncbi:AI-2E family transporter [Clostridium gasigenes]|uniref:Predicted PurR-regulated permease PerM n=1 Tax=Clostridium gasigenes TaxID=94869 RepID=A0A1H0N245_9CLOT|nr:AI-2E family transporter [Clostridium gasigenes]MBB6625210.1 AI-2E family transporter [Clostridium gasigenes]MBU3087402.1 AI-2E family transporter [Clostridium gasigenes]NKF05365.1 AI-2E family transporter [Clostridium gasigenes]QSW18815.1 AI-2E family transporter [Clostridium gasigenes]SDO86586.1 Predicted PurR-regulated permease PerM [Clostridium gasigenes]